MPSLGKKLARISAFERMVLLSESKPADRQPRRG